MLKPVLWIGIVLMPIQIRKRLSILTPIKIRIRILPSLLLFTTFTMLYLSHKCKRCHNFCNLDNILKFSGKKYS
jgi:hypothetical protein